ncbi:MAG: hypothetical protein COV29_02960 [Candidatus Yanofskybacteria bacterium CG10_big_fil_rev_8_21_14_0_10_36_16]|uniref:Acyl-CoA dehydrogenase n=1 Tax=Candidatus Yanofskybacteria bacterium CG10_big_fil_rev_8_21_14_0_10_36_16 TaxID=1975096 RepID=A0A2J0Q6U3_9BACT|nr:MAG: hypothetical protein COV29_02960 [Candidatus Yanofskybacteria bacterium CG10_big_fil_rev_8_21_14_0_10_36_16]
MLTSNALNPVWETEDYLMLRKSVKDFCRDEVLNAKREGKPLVQWMDENEETPEELWQKLAGLGVFGVSLPEQYGGFEMGKIGACIVSDELGYVDPAFALAVGAHMSLASEAIALFGNDEQKERYLSDLVSAKKIGALASTEQGVGSDVASMSTMAEKVDGGWVVNGNKQFITNAEIADVMVIIAQTQKGGGNKTMAMFILDLPSDGIKGMVREEKMGLHASLTNSFAIEDVFIPDNNLMGEVGGGFKMLMNVFNRSRITLAGCCVGMMRRAIDEAWNYTWDRRVFGKRILEFPTTHEKLAEMEVLKTLVESMTFDAAWRVDRGLDVKKFGAIAKYAGSEMAFKCIDSALQLHGGQGYMKSYAVEKLFRDVRAWRIFEGTSLIQLFTVFRSDLKTRLGM